MGGLASIVDIYLCVLVTEKNKRHTERILLPFGENFDFISAILVNFLLTCSTICDTYFCTFVLVNLLTFLDAIVKWSLCNGK